MSSNARREAIRAITTQRPPEPSISHERESLQQLFGRNVFGDRQMQDRLPKPVYQSLKQAIREGADLDAETADVIANAMKDWAIERGATHFTHWFQPMTGLTAEKHDSFLSVMGDELIVKFSGSQLIRGEPDASSFPSGGIRATFEARGYTAWDPSSPAFIIPGKIGGTLCIPTAFCSWTGEALDKKTPLLRSNEALAREAGALLEAIGENSHGRVFPTCGTEQEYFLVDRQLLALRPDLQATGRTLVGARPPKGQELEDHYFGTISPRVLAFMEDVEMELWQLGVPVQTRHQEVAPSQFELAPTFERSNIAVDHNMLTMDVLRKTAQRHGFVCLLHEKPFEGVNGSGKHNNWSLATDDGLNLLDPGKTPAESQRFLLFLTAVIRAVDLHADLLRISIARAGNDHRLGANEAPPAIISIYLGSELEGVVNALIEGESHQATGDQVMNLGTSTLQPLPRDNTDRNRTSPFAFTGNKFEFRAVGSGQSVALPNTVLNTIMAESCRFLRTEIETRTAGGAQLADAIQSAVVDTLKAHRRVLFTGDNYSQDWVEEAERRGLPNLRTTVDALAHYNDEKNQQLFEELGVYSRRELQSRANIAHESYAKALLIESQSTLAIASTMVLPAALKYQERAARAITETRQAATDIDLSAQEEQLHGVSRSISDLSKALGTLGNAYRLVEAIDDEHGQEQATSARDQLIPGMNAVREACDALEKVVDDELWPLPKYRELLFVQ